MGECIIYGNGGSNPLNFKVVGGTSAHSSPKANTIWVNTDQNITKWYFDTEEPNVYDIQNYSDGDPWILVSPHKLSEGDILNFTIPATVPGTFEAIRIHDPYAHKYYYIRSYGSGLAGTAWPAGTKVGVVISNDRHPIGGWGGTDDSGTAYITAWDSYYHKAGTVWIKPGAFSSVEFNALKKNSIQVKPATVKQYVSGAWADKTAKSYQGGKWVDWWGGQLVDGSVLPKTPFGQMVLNLAGHSQATAEMSAEKGGLYIYIPKVSNSYSKAYLTPWIDVTDYNTLTVTWQARGYTNKVGFTDAIITDGGTTQSFVASAEINPKGSTMSAVTVSTIDISHLSGKYLLCATTAGSASSNANLYGELLLTKAVLS